MVRSSTPVIELRGLTKQYGLGDAAQNALDNVDLRVEKGEFIVIMGPSGCGKTTLLNIMGLLDRADSGEYFLDGTSVATLSKRQHARIRSRQIGIVFQSFNLINRLTVLENVALPLSYRGGDAPRQASGAGQCGAEEFPPPRARILHAVAAQWWAGAARGDCSRPGKSPVDYPGG